MLASLPFGVEVAIVGLGAAATLGIVSALLFWIDQEWRERDRQDQRPPDP